MASTTPERAARGEPVSASRARDAVASIKLWYHTLELAPGVFTPGHFDLRPIVDRLPWPDVSGLRCLDVGPWDGFYSFELERRGAAEVVVADIGDQREWDWPFRERALGPAAIEAMGGKPGEGFRVARDLLGSSAERIEASVYDLDPAAVGTFDLVVCGSLLLHLRDPVRALEAIRGVCRGRLLSVEAISLPDTFLSPRRPVAALNGIANCQWWKPNLAAHRRMIAAAGFELERTTRPFAIPFGSGHPSPLPARSPGAVLQRMGRLAMTGGIGMPHAAVLARPAD